MLKTPVLFRPDPGLALIFSVIGGGSSQPVVLGDGLLKITHFSSDMLLYGKNGGWDFEIEGMPEYGVCDSPDQLVAKFGDILSNDPRNLCVFFTHVRKDTSNRGQRGGWRWHKWGEYVGEGTPEYEYLDDETGFDGGVYVYHVHDIDWQPKEVSA